MTARSPTGFVERIRFATVNSLRGIKFAFASEQAFRHEIFLLVLALPLGIWIAPSFAWYVAMIGVLLLVIAIELLNTGLEKLCDHVMADHHPQIGIVKDCGSAGVMFSLLLAGLIWMSAFLVRFFG
ncbi:MAG: diacylglycerol kinase [Pseudorhodoplanes sp.]|nr:diacylglycerol kinase [Pseudorhodoplanes sp.]